MLPLDQIFLKVFRSDESEAVVSDQVEIDASVSVEACDLPNLESDDPRTINFPESVSSEVPRVLAFDQQGRSTKERKCESVELEKDRVKFAEDFCPSRRFRKLYIQQREENERLPDQEPSLKLHEESELNCGESVSESVSRRTIQEQALRLLAEQTDSGIHVGLSVSEIERDDIPCEPRHIFPIGQPGESSVEQASAEEPVEDQEVEEGEPAGTLESEPVAQGHIPRICHSMLLRANFELSAIGDVLEKTIESGHKVVGFKGTGEKCGSSTILLGVAAELASRGLAVLVVDGSFEHPSLASALGVKNCVGWDEAVFRKTPLESAMVRINLPLSEKSDPEGGQDHFCFLPLIPQTVSRAIVASCKKEWLRKIMDLSDRFDLVLIDTGSYGPDSLEEKIQEMLRFGIDGFFLVKDTRSRACAYIPELVEEVRKFELCCLGIIENFT